MILLRNGRERTRFFRFAVIGTIGALIDFSAFNLFSVGLGIKPVIASVLSFLIAVTSNFIGNRYWTYPDSRSKAAARQLMEFTVVNVIGLGIRTPIFVLLEEPFGALLELVSIPMPFDPMVIGHNLALASAIVVVLFWNFFANRYWTYMDVE